MEKIKNLFKRPLSAVLILLAVFAGWGVYAYFKKVGAPPYELTAVKKGVIAQKVSVTGRVKPAQNVYLAF